MGQIDQIVLGSDLKWTAAVRAAATGDEGSPVSSLRSRAMRASVCTAVGIGRAHLLRLGSNLELTRLLLPECFAQDPTVCRLFESGSRCLPPPSESAAGEPAAPPRASLPRMIGNCHAATSTLRLNQ